jgi:uncharacterized protein (TIGR02271 family)
MAQLITGLFHDRAEAEQAVADLQNLGYSQNDISVMMNDAGQAQAFAADTGTKAAEGAGVGAGIGGTLGAIIAALTATGSVAAIAATGGLAAPLVAGPLAAALAGAGAGGLTGGIIGGLIGAGIPEERARYYEQGLNSGGILLGVHANDTQEPEVRQVLERDGADDVRGRSDGADIPRGNTASQRDFVNAAPVPPVPSVTQAPVPMAATEDRTLGNTSERIQLREEELTAQKREVQSGEVTIHKEIVTETRTIDVPVTREEVVIERHSVGTAVNGNAEFGQNDQEIRIPIMEEQVTIEKTPIVTEEVEIGRRRVTETQHMTDTVRHEELRVDDPTDHRSEMADPDPSVQSSSTNR